jgi:hypothetical protein
MPKPVSKRTRSDGRRYILVDEAIHKRLSELSVKHGAFMGRLADAVLREGLEDRAFKVILAKATAAMSLPQ